MKITQTLACTAFTALISFSAWAQEAPSAEEGQANPAATTQTDNAQTGNDSSRAAAPQGRPMMGNRGQMPMRGYPGHMPMGPYPGYGPGMPMMPHPSRMPMMGGQPGAPMSGDEAGASASNNPGGMPGMQMRKERREMMQKHQQAMEERMANIESLLQQLVDQGKQGEDDKQRIPVR